MSNRAWVTLATNDSYGLGALVLAHSLRRAGSAYPAVVLITPAVTEPMRERLRAVFAEVIVVDVLDSGDAAHLALLRRPELGITFTKIHCWSLTQYEKCVFLDADTLVVQNSDDLFEREELSAAPDVGWPDCFNSGVFVYKPSQETFDALIRFAQERGSFDGGDQGLLNSFFSDWAHGDISKHLPFLYNVTSAAFYSYLPALKHYGQDLKIIHFIGAAKPWLQSFNWDSRTVDAPAHLQGLLQLWWEIFVASVHQQLDISMSGVAGNLARVAIDSGHREAIDELTRRQGWEAGNIDYMGADSFDNIWAKISQTLNQTPKQPSAPPSNSTPPPKIPSPSRELPPVDQPSQAAESQPIEVKQDATPAAVEVPKEAEPISIQENEALASQPEPPQRTEQKVPPTPPATPQTTPDPASTPVSETAPEIVAKEAPKAQATPIEIITEAAPTKPAAASVETPANTEAAPTKPAEETAEAAANKETAPVKAAPEVPVEIKPATPVAPVQSSSTPVTSVPLEPAPASPAVADTALASPAVADTALASPAKPAETSVQPIPATPSEVPLDDSSLSLKTISTPDTTLELSATDSPPLANTPAKEEGPPTAVAKSTEEAAQETRL